MKYLAILSLAVSIAHSQTVMGGLAGTVVDGKTLTPIPGALVIARFVGTPPLAKNTKSGGDGAFQIQGLAAGRYLLCVQAPGGGYLDPCQWNGSPTNITVASGQTASGVLLKLTAASVVNIQVQDPLKALSQSTKDGHRPSLTIGVWGPKGLYYPALRSGASSAGGYHYQLAVPHDTPLNFYIASHDLKLGDAGGMPLPANASQQAFQHITGDPNPKSFAFTVLGLLP